MTVHRWASALAVTSTLALSATAASSQQLVGRVFDGTSGNPVAGAEVAVQAPNQTDLVGLAVTDSAGHFQTVIAAPGQYGLIVTAPGYETLTSDSLTVGQEETVTVELVLGPRPFDVEAIRVVARAVQSRGHQEFYERQDRYEKLGLGLILDREELERHTGITADAVLVRESINVSFSTSTGRPFPRIIVKRWAQMFGKPPWCTPAFFLDGYLASNEAVRALPASTLEGLELYRGPAEVPAQYSWAPGAMDCGVILAWTSREGRRGLSEEKRPALVGAYLAAGSFDAVRPEVIGVEAEVGMTRGLAGWIAVGLVPAECDVPAGMTCVEPGVPWTARIGMSLFPTGDDLPVSPYVGAGYGIGSPGPRIEPVHLWRLGVEMEALRARLRLELRSGPAGWGVGVGVMF